MSILVEHNGVNINDYIISCDRIPNYYMNLDGTPGLPDYSMEVSNTYSGTFAQGNIINVTVNGTMVHNGFIQSSEILYESRSTRLTILPTLAHLQDYKIDPDELGLADSDPENYYMETLVIGGGLPDQYAFNVKLLWFINRMFAKAGLALDASAVATYQTGTVHQLDSPWAAIPFTGDDIALDEGAIFCLNQDFACPPSMVKVTQNAEGQDITDWTAVYKLPTYFEVITQILNYLYWGIIFNDGYKLVPLVTRTAVSVTDNSVYQFSHRSEGKENAHCIYRTNFATRWDYILYTKTQLPTPYSEASPGAFGDWRAISWMNNLWFMIKDRRDGATVGSVRTDAGIRTLTSEDPWNAFGPRPEETPIAGSDGPSYIVADNYKKDKIITETETDFNTNTLNVFEHYFDLENRTTILKEVTFL